ncbi:MAG: tRNA pseudouridine(38-40) synthase TruA [Elusimicrobia bacterium]|jgi:tRNA pseudouridine38-40 synthase|nr:tRNA pseudouridine(38-40) synthase TruA [Elusimicrobiota bacterium]
MNFKARVEYDGTKYFGWQIQPGVPTVQGKIEKTLKEVTGSNIRIKYASRTDRGVHARGQVISFNIERDISKGRISHVLNSKTDDDIIIKDLKECSADFNPRYNVSYKLYKYRILNRELNDYMLKDFVWHINYKLDKSIIKEALNIIEGKHNFKNFSSCKDTRKDTNIIVSETNYTQTDDGLLVLSVKGEYFLTYMIRYLVGFIKAAAEGKETLDKLGDMLKGEGELSSYCAPALGLELSSIKYR